MNSADKARLEELKVRVYAKYAVKCLEKDDDLTLNDHEIECKGNMVNKAIRLLEGAGTIKRVKRDPLFSHFEIVNMEDARQYEYKPLHTWKWWNLAKEVEDTEDFLTFMSLDYQPLYGLKDTEEIYIYFHKNEFDIKVRRDNNFYYRKDLVERRDKFVLKCIVEQEIKYNLPKYIQFYAGTEPEAVTHVTSETFKFDKYCISTVIEQNDLNTIFETYTKHYEKIMAYQKSIDKFVLWVDSVGGFEEALRIIRKGIIEDLRNNFVRFEESFRYVDDRRSKRNDFDGSLTFINRVKDLFTYEILYAEGEMDGEKVDINKDINLEDNFDEPKEDDQKKAA
jgi:hypothetical protein